MANCPIGSYMFKVNNRNTRTRCEIYSKLTIKTPERRSGAFIMNFEHISHLVLVFLLLTLSRYMPAESKKFRKTKKKTTIKIPERKPHRGVLKVFSSNADRDPRK